MADLFDIAIARKLSGGGGGGGSVQPLICEYDSDLGHLDTTVGDIVNAVLAGRPVYFKKNVNGNGYDLGFLQGYQIAEDIENLYCYATVFFNGAVLSTDIEQTVEALYEEYPFYSD